MATVPGSDTVRLTSRRPLGLYVGSVVLKSLVMYVGLLYVIIPQISSRNNPADQLLLSKTCQTIAKP